MENNTNLTVNSEELKAAFEGGGAKKPRAEKAAATSAKPKHKLTNKKLMVFWRWG